MPGGVFTEGEPFGNEATAFIKEQIMQKEVEIEVETMDKGNLIIPFSVLNFANLKKVSRLFPISITF